MAALADRPSEVDPRIAQTRTRVILATRDLIAEGGLANASVEKIAAHSGVARSTIYRRWGDLNSLHADALGPTGGSGLAEATGDTPADLRRYLDELAQRLNDRAYFMSFLSLIERAGRDERFADAHRRTVEAATSQAADLIEAGRRSGHLRDGIDPDRALEALLGPFLFLRVIAHRPITDERIEQGIDDFMARFGHPDR